MRPGTVCVWSKWFQRIFLLRFYYSKFTRWCQACVLQCYLLVQINRIVKHESEVCFFLGGMDNFVQIFFVCGRNDSKFENSFLVFFVRFVWCRIGSFWIQVAFVFYLRRLHCRMIEMKVLCEMKGKCEFCFGSTNIRNLFYILCVRLNRFSKMLQNF